MFKAGLTLILGHNCKWSIRVALVTNRELKRPGPCCCQMKVLRGSADTLWRLHNLICNIFTLFLNLQHQLMLLTVVVVLRRLTSWEIPSVFPLNASWNCLAYSRWISTAHSVIWSEYFKSRMKVLRLGVFTLVSGVKTGNIEVDENIKENCGEKKSNYATTKLAATTS